MAASGWTAVALAVGVVAAAATAKAEERRIPLTVNLRNDAGLSEGALADARRLTAQIYAQAGVEVTWSSDEPELTIILLKRASIETMRRAKDAMGYAPGTENARGRVAFVLIDRINAVAAGYGVPRSIVLGMAVAHELGHLLLFNAHSDDGVMRADWNQADFRNAANGRLLFTEGQVRSIRERLSTTAGTLGSALR